MTDNQGRFMIKDYNKKAVFSNFLPGISGEHGIPIWCYYVNRGQCISCFGVQDKDHSIMEFNPAHQAYQQTERMGFRTFIKADGAYEEAFTDSGSLSMYIGMNELEIRNEGILNKFDMSVQYYTLPEEELGGLIRIVKLKNTGDSSCEVEIADGMPALIPYGVSLPAYKNMGQTAKAWMEVNDHKNKLPYFKVRASMEDTAEVKEVSGGNFAYAFDEKGERLPVIVSAETIFSYDTALKRAHNFINKGIDLLLDEEQITKNDVPCCFFLKKTKLEPNAEIILYEVYGQTEEKSILNRFHNKINSVDYFYIKQKDARELTVKLTDKIAVKTGNELFDAYCRQTYLDNILRGGNPILLGNNKVFYLYSRKHGDMERDYNYFRMLPEFYSQGNGNFRDVNQNRRSDVLFSPFIGNDTIKTFYSFIQIDGYNPLGIEKRTYRLEAQHISDFTKVIEEGERDLLNAFLAQSFTPGELLGKLKQFDSIAAEEIPYLFDKILETAVSENKTDFIEGYWTDHWTYNLDLIDAYCKVYPDKEEELLFSDCSYTYRSSDATILPSQKRYVKRSKGIRQYHFLVMKEEKETDYLVDDNGKVIYSTLFEKLFLLTVVKFAALDPYGMGIEMEGGKPGWYDALNGLPGLLGASVSETLELIRNLNYTMNILEKYPQDIFILKDVSDLAAALSEAILKNQSELNKKGAVINFWNDINRSKAQYIMRTKDCAAGTKVLYKSVQLLKLLKEFETVLLRGIKQAVSCGNGICPTYFYYDVTDYYEDSEGIHPTKLNVRTLPYFLEGPVHYLKLELKREEKLTLYQKIKESPLYDKKLKMYKVNAPLTDTSSELGRARAFTSGWLENESIWLHMEYKYLLELLKSHLYHEFIIDFKNAAIPFQNESIYGRSLFENSSFIASSANPNQRIHGKGFVARLSGATAEFLNIWQLMMFGDTPFYQKHGGLHMAFSPLIPSYLIGENRRIEAVFLGEIPVIYHLTDNEDYIPGNYIVKSYTVKDQGSSERIDEQYISGDLCEQIRDRRVDSIEIEIMRL